MSKLAAVHVNADISLYLYLTSMLTLSPLLLTMKHLPIKSISLNLLDSNRQLLLVNDVGTQLLHATDLRQ